MSLPQNSRRPESPPFRVRRSTASRAQIARTRRHWDQIPPSIQLSCIPRTVKTFSARNKNNSHTEYDENSPRGRQPSNASRRAPLPQPFLPPHVPKSAEASQIHDEFS